MIKAEIQVGFNKYQIDFPGATDLEKVYNYALEIATGHRIHKGADGWLDLNKKEYDHIRVWDETPQPVLPFGMAPPPNIVEAAEENPAIASKRIEIFQQKIDLEVAQYANGETVFILPYKLNGEAAVYMLRRETLRSVAEEYAKLEGLQTFEIVLPHGPIMDDQEALAFVMDYAAETAEARLQLLKETDKAARGIDWDKIKG
ncbi:hypothetical protein ACF5W4_11220 [Bacillota bacterium Lsc_1132]